MKSGDKVRIERSVGIEGGCVGLCDLSPETLMCDPFPLREEREEARWMVTTDEEEAELGRED